MHLYQAADPALTHLAALCEVRPGTIGQSLYWRGSTVPAKTALISFFGPVVTYSEISEAKIRYVVRFDRDHYLVPESDAQLANHSCDPNCRINDQFAIETLRTLQPGEEITISYDHAAASDITTWGDFWDFRWTFPCACGSSFCVGQVHGYRIIKP
jgi:hypothetical protein